MRTQKERVQAHRFVTRRLMSAMLAGDPESIDQPMRRLAQATFASAMVATIILAAVGVIGLVTGRSGPVELNTLVIERGTGATFVYVDTGAGPTLHPVLNYASARLILGVADPVERTVSPSALRDLRRGPTLGIPDAPASLPQPNALVDLPWSACNIPGATRSTARVVIGQSLGAGRELGDGEALLVSNGETRFLVVGGRRLNITETVAYATLGLTVPSVRVMQQVLNTVPAGPDLEVFAIEGTGTRLTDRRIGDEAPVVGSVYRDGNGTYYVLTLQGLVRVGEVYGQLRLARDNNNRGESSEPRPVTSAELAEHLVTSRVLEPDGYPTRVPTLINDEVGPNAVFCTTFARHGDDVRLSFSVHSSIPEQLAPGAPGMVPLRPTGRDPAGVAGDAVIAGGRGAIVAPIPAPGAAAGGTTIYLVTDQGVKYPLGNRDVDALAALGYGEVTPTGVPADLLALLPTGPTLTGAAARQAVVPAGSPPAPSSSPEPAPSSSPGPAPA
jgi:type VII secretion protein EccB